MTEPQVADLEQSIEELQEELNKLELLTQPAKMKHTGKPCPATGTWTCCNRSYSIHIDNGCKLVSGKEVIWDHPGTIEDDFWTCCGRRIGLMNNGCTKRVCLKKKSPAKSPTKPPTAVTDTKTTNNPTTMAKKTTVAVTDQKTLQPRKSTAGGRHISSIRRPASFNDAKGLAIFDWDGTLVSTKTGEPFPEIQDLLKDLLSEGWMLAIATFNQKIHDHVAEWGWLNLFSHIGISSLYYYYTNLTHGLLIKTATSKTSKVACIKEIASALDVDLTRHRSRLCFFDDLSDNVVEVVETLDIRSVKVNPHIGVTEQQIHLALES